MRLLSVPAQAPCGRKSIEGVQRSGAPQTQTPPGVAAHSSGW